MLQFKSLSYKYDSFEPFLSKESFEFHYEKHHKTYFDNLVNLIKNNSLFEDKSVKEIAQLCFQKIASEDFKVAQGAFAIPDNLYKKIYNNAAQHFNHDFFWQSIDPKIIKPSQLFLSLIEKSFNSLEEMELKFFEKGLQVFGSGWVWLVFNIESKTLEFLQTSNAIFPDDKEYKLLLVCDVWEHAYYIDYRNKRADYLKFIFSKLNWQFAEENLNI